MWKFFAKENPNERDVIDIIWSDGTQDVSRWTTTEDIDWNAEVFPVCWRLNSWENE